MKLISCSGCGVVLDQDNLSFPLDYETFDGIDVNKAIWDGEGWVPAVLCPVCSHKIPKET